MAPSAAADLVAVWASLEPAARAVLPDARPLGYRGCRLREEGAREWTARAGVVCLRAGGELQFREDPARRFERALVATAPAGALPPFLDL